MYIGVRILYDGRCHVNNVISMVKDGTLNMLFPCFVYISALYYTHNKVMYTHMFQSIGIYPHIYIPFYLFLSSLLLHYILCHIGLYMYTYILPFMFSIYGYMYVSVGIYK